MTTLALFNDYQSRNSFKKIFDYKGEIAPITEKASRNLKMKATNEVNRNKKVHYFAIGHAFKQIDTEHVFSITLDEETRKKHAHHFLSLQKMTFNFTDDLTDIISHIRNINSHYIHDFQKLKLETLSRSFISFLKESFELAVLHIYLQEKKTSFTEYEEQRDSDSQLVSFLYDKFYPLSNPRNNLSETAQKSLDEYKTVRKHFRSLSKDAAIEALLFVQVDEEFDWLLYGEHKTFTISAGKYLSYHTCLFLLGMLLYKSEANQLISKIKGFKKTKEDLDKSKREIFTFFSKKLSSQDVNSEAIHLVKFRDIVQYLNRYPKAWNNHLELESKHPAMTDKLKSKIIEMEMDRCFPDFAGNERFHVFAKYQIWGKKYLGKSIEKQYIKYAFQTKEIEDFNYETNTSAEYKGAKIKLADLKASTRQNIKEIEKVEQLIRKTKNDPNEDVIKLKERIEKDLLFVSYGRNVDRFMQFACRYLAEVKYFGAGAKFKLYRFYDNDEQDTELSNLKSSLSKKEYDKLKFHDGRLVHFSSISEHLSRNESWDTPFVLENNAIKVKLTFAEGVEKTITIQRSLMVYLLEHALFNTNGDTVENEGKQLLEAYVQFHQNDFSEGLKKLQEQKPISSEEKGRLMKLFPKKLLHTYCPAVKNSPEEPNHFEKLYNKTLEHEERYAKLLAKAEKEKRLDDFVKRNKGKQFKLQFIRKAWNYMYFKDIYLKQVESSEHHKRFHITRDEFNDFSRFMFAFDEVPSYKGYLHEMLDQKGFFENQEFKALYDSCRSLDNLYFNTKKAFGKWMLTCSARSKPADSHKLANYNEIIGNEMLHINLSHFISFLDAGEKLQRDGIHIKYKSLENAQYLIGDYYYADRLAPHELKDNTKLFSKLRSAKLEDALLYEMAMHYIKLDTHITNKAKSHISEILKQDVEFVIENAKGEHKYNLKVPFKTIESYVGIVALKKEQDKRHKGNYFANIYEYISKVKNDTDRKDRKDRKDIKAIYENLVTIGVLRYDELHKIDALIITNSIKFTKLAMELEKYYLCKPDASGTVEIYPKGESHKETGCFHVTWDKTGIPKTYYQLSRKENIRNKAFHFGIPSEKTYVEQITEIEKEFIRTEVKPESPQSFYQLYTPQKSVCSALLKAVHNKLFDHKHSNKRQDAEQKYFTQIISK